MRQHNLDVPSATSDAAEAQAARDEVDDVQQAVGSVGGDDEAAAAAADAAKIVTMNSFTDLVLHARHHAALDPCESV